MTEPILTFLRFRVLLSMLITNMGVFLGFQVILWAKTEFEIPSLRHLMNKSRYLCSKMGCFVMAGVTVHTNAHLSRMNQSDPGYIGNQILKVQISEYFGTWSNIPFFKCISI